MWLEVALQCCRCLQTILQNRVLEDSSLIRDMRDHLSMTASMMSRIMMIRTKIVGITNDSVRNLTE